MMHNAPHRFTLLAPPVLVLLLLSACKVGPNYHRPEAPVASAYKEDQDWKPEIGRAHV